jgi:hypothetical protein
MYVFFSTFYADFLVVAILTQKVQNKLQEEDHFKGREREREREREKEREREGASECTE